MVELTEIKSDTASRSSDSRRCPSKLLTKINSNPSLRSFKHPNSSVEPEEIYQYSNSLKPSDITDRSSTGILSMALINNSKSLVSLKIKNKSHLSSGSIASTSNINAIIPSQTPISLPSDSESTKTMEIDPKARSLPLHTKLPPIEIPRRPHFKTSDPYEYLKKTISPTKEDDEEYEHELSEKREIEYEMNKDISDVVKRHKSRDYYINNEDKTLPLKLEPLEHKKSKDISIKDDSLINLHLKEIDEDIKYETRSLPPPDEEYSHNSTHSK